MWDYDKLFADGNVVGIKNCYRNKVYNNVVDVTTGITWLEGYKNEELSCKDQYVDVDDTVKHGYTTDFEIQYIVRLDKHGNVVEKLFDRETDMKPEPNPIPELKDGMFVKVHSCENDEDILAFIYNGRVIYQDGDWDEICDIMNEDYNLILEVYSPETLCFKDCEECNLLWRSPNYQSN